MDKVFSTRLDESVVHRIQQLAQQLGMTKKAVVEAAIQMLVEKMESTNDLDVFTQTCGAWQREEPPETTVQQAREAFRHSMERHHQ